MTKGRLLSLFGPVTLAVAVSGAGDARAICSDGRNMVTYSGQFGNTYLYFAPDASLDPTVAVGRWWATGNFGIRGGEGTNCGDEQWLLPGPGTSFGVFCYIGGSAGFGFCDNTGACPADPGDLHVLIQTTRPGGAQFGLYRVAFTPAAVHGYDLSKDGLSMNAVDIPKPKILSSSRVGTTINLTLRLEGVNAAFEGDNELPPYLPEQSITGYRLVEGVGLLEPGRIPSSWTLKSTHGYTGGNVDVTTSVDCSNIATDSFLGIQLVFDNGQVVGDHVGASVRVECNPNLAEPGKFRLIEKRRAKSGLRPTSRNE